MKTKGLFIISLDFELLWGVRDKKTKETYGKNIEGVRRVIPALLKLFSRYEVHATFATVGFLFCRNKKELLSYLPDSKPQYIQPHYSPYENNYLDEIGDSEQDDIYHYAPSLIKLIQQSPGQEIASHTFSHFYCLEDASLESFEADLIASKKIALEQYGITLKSIVFPRNQYSKEHLEICKKLGFTSFRGTESSSIYQPRKNEEQSKRIRALRMIDTYFNINGHHSAKVWRQKNRSLINIPSSRFLRPYSKNLKLFDQLRLERILNSMTYAAKHHHAFHLWWHPHNFGVNLEENMVFLKKIIQHYFKLSWKYGMQSRNMGEVAAEMIRQEVK